MITGKIAKLETLGTLDGPGVRTVVFFQGCVLRCAYCHNPALLTLQGGTEMTAQELFEKVVKFKQYFKNGGGVTVSGGEPLIQTEFLTEFFKLCKQNEINTCLDTSGVGFGDFDELLKYTDLALLDIKHTDVGEFKKLTLIDKDRTAEFHNALKANKTPIWLRQVIIPDVTDNEAYLDSLLKEILKFDTIEKVEFLPFHTMATTAYDELGIEYRYKGKPAMDNIKCTQLLNLFLQKYKPYNNKLINF
ncbi:MAG: pyruvate formate-lyase-activating protein [Christensenellales bacterium]|jgi:pyruvate formate lyase activating enzyme